METEQIGMSVPETEASAARQGVEEAKKIGSSARRRVLSTADQKKAQFLQGVDGWLEKVEGLSGKGIVPEGVIERARGARDTIRSRSTEQLLDDFGTKARERPALFVFGALAAGFVAGRILRDVGSNP